jgi:vacuolar-type H+-ATPase subunit E/Vma4
MPLEDILQTIRAEGDRVCAEIAAEAGRRVAVILAEAEARAADLRAAELRQGAEVRHSERTALLYQARLEASRRRSAAWQEAYQATLDAARAVLAAVPDRPDYGDILRSLLVEALAELDSTPVVNVTARDEPRLAEMLQDLKVDAQLEHRLKGWGGLEARTADNRIIVRNTLESRLARAEPALPAVVSAVWQSGGTPAAADPPPDAAKGRPHA